MSGMVRWGILGTARINRAFIEGVGLSTESCVQAIASREWTRANEWAKNFGVPRAFGSYDELIHSGEVDAIYNPLPNSMHCEWTIRALEAGLPVLCEKPFAANAAQARDMVATSRRTGVLLAEAFMYRYHPIYDHVMERVTSGDLGDLVSIRVSQCFCMTDRSTNIRASAELAGGAVMDVGCYCINFCRRVTGEEPVRAIAFERRTTVDDTFMGTLAFPGGTLAQFEVSMESQGRSRAEIAGTKGLIVMDKPFFPGREDTHFTIRRGDSEEIVRVPGVDCYHLEVKDFVHAMQTGRDTRWPAEDAILNMAVIDAVYAAAKQGRAVDVAR